MDGKIKVLIVEDDQTLAMSSKMILEQDEAVQVVGIAVGGAQGIKMVERLCPSLVFIGLNLPDDNGLHIVNLLKGHSPAVHLVMYTRYDYIPFLDGLIEAGVSGIISKGASAEQVLRMLHCVMKGDTVLFLPASR